MTLAPDIGRIALSLAFLASLAAVVLCAYGARTGGTALVLAGRRAVYAAFLATLVSMGMLITSFVVSDFSVLNVALNSHVDKPFVYKVAAAWGSHESSMLLWCLVAAGYAAAFTRSMPVTDALGVRATTVLAAIAAGFFAFILFASNPFARVIDPPLEGNGFNPLLQDPAMALHPPFLYLGYVGMCAPFAVAVAALWRGDAADKSWARVIQRWTLIPFAFLTVGIALGSYWAYYELGWGGWWFWDPVENSSLMPWLLAAALLHSALVTARTGALAGWTILLAILAFGMALLGTFLTRSGLITSVHAFASDPFRGQILLGMLAVMIGLALAVFAARAGRLGKAASFSPQSRETAIVVNNALLTHATAVVLLGTTYPLLHELFGPVVIPVIRDLVAAFSPEWAFGIRYAPVTVGEPYFERTVLPGLALMMLAAPFGPLLAWRRGDAAAAAMKLRIAAALGVMAGAALLVIAGGGAVGPAVATGLGAWVLVAACQDFVRRAGWPRVGLGAGFAALRLRPRVMAAPLAHAGVGLLVLGAGVEAALHVEAAGVVAPGQAFEVGERTVSLDAVRRADGPNYAADRAAITIAAPGAEPVRLSPEQRFYPVADQTTTEVAIRSDLRGDLYVAFGPPQAGPDGPRWTIRVLINPLIWAVFLGASLIAAGGALALIRPWRNDPAS